MSIFTVDAEFPGGNVVVDNIDGDNMRLRQDLRDTSVWWFYWNFRVRGAAGRTLKFLFDELPERSVFGGMGPCFSVDGIDWEWLGRDAISGQSFEFVFPEGMDQAYFAFGIAYTETHLRRFLVANPHIRSTPLNRSEKGREVELLRAPSEHGTHKVLLTARHHACEAVANYVLEGVLQLLDEDSPEGDFLRRHVDIIAIPFMDKDGVEDGDQGKCRLPYDHWEDYTDLPIYASTSALMEQAPGWGGPLALAIDLHCPYYDDDQIFCPIPEPEWSGKFDRFASILEQTQQGELRFVRDDCIPYGTAWNRGGDDCSSYLRKTGLADLAFVLEFPYARAHNTTVTAPRARCFGRDLARAMARYLKVKDQAR